eukprot:m.19359 g.19359  ORF g.19359 m.19359 type:complete len:640 (+) comp6549_c0_seq1:41-1960(+)
MASKLKNIQRVSEDDDEALLSYDAQPNNTLYNMGPRQKTDKICGYMMIGTIVVFIAWCAIGAITFSSDESYKLPWNVDIENCANNTNGLAGTYLGSEEQDNLAAAIAVPIVLGIIGSFFMGALVLIGFKFFPTFMVYSVVIVKTISPAIVGVYLYVKGQSIAEVDDDDIQTTGNPLAVPAYALFAMSAFIGLIFFCFRASLALSVELFRESSYAMEDNWALIPVNALIVFCSLLLKIGMIFGLVWYILHGSPDSCVCEENVYNNEKFCQAEWKMTGSTKILLPFASFAIGWFMFWSLQTRTYIVADSVGFWYWSGKDGKNISRAVGHAFGAHFGSLAFAGLVLWIVEFLKKQARKKTANPFVCMIQLIIRCILSYIEYLCKMSVILVGIAGKPFADSGRDVVDLFTSSFGNMSLSTGIWWIPSMILNAFVVIMSIVWGAGTGFVVYETAKEKIDEDSDALLYGLITGVINFIICLFILAFFANVMLSIIDTVFICYLLDKKRGVVTKPKIHEVLESVLSRKNITIRQVMMPPGQGQQQVIMAAPPQQQQVYRQQPVVHQQHVTQPVQQQQQFQQYPQQPQQQFQQYPPQQQYAPQQQPFQQQAQQAPQYTPPPAANKFCPSCGTPAAGSKFCQQCGQQL